MRTQLLLMILACSRSKILKIDPNIGVGIESNDHKNVHFYTHRERLEFSRIYYAACYNVPEFEIKLALDDSRCDNFKEEIIEGNLKKFQNECVSVWKNKMNQVLTYEHPRNKRAVTVSMVLGAVSAFSMLISAVKNTLEINNLATRVGHFEERNERILTEYKNNQIKVAALSSYISSDLDRLSSSLCGKTLQDTLDNSNSLATIMIDSYLEHVTKETLAVASGEIPNTLDFVTDLKILCEKFNEPDFCYHAINDKAIKISFEKASLDKDLSLHIIMTIDMPIQSKKFLNSIPIVISNVGFFKNDSFFELELPKNALITDEKIYGLDTEMCTNSICHVNSVYFDSSVMCLSDFYKNRTNSCKATDYGQKSICSFLRVGDEGYLISVTSGLFNSNENDLLEVTNLDSKTFWTSDAGHLICYENDDMASFLILGRAKIYTASLKPKLPIMKIEVDVSKYNITFNKSIKENFNDTLNELLQNDDSVQIFGQKYDTVQIIIISCFLSTVSCLILSNFSAFLTLIKVAFEKLSHICLRRRNQISIRYVIENNDRTDYTVLTPSK